LINVAEDVAVTSTEQRRDDPLLTMAEVAARTRMPVGTLRSRRVRRLRPRGFRVGLRVMYRTSEVESWLADQERAETTSG
jgi:predicted DNA-binding transcriptional regulator AlpA